MTKGYRKLTLTAACLVLMLVAGLGIVDDIGKEYTERGFKRALMTFAVARSLNGVISVAQGTEVAIQPAGIGLNFTPGQILDPINDLIERFSWVMLASSTSLGLQKILMGIFASKSFTVLLGSVLLLFVMLLWYQGKKVNWLQSLVFKSALFLLFLRFSIPVVALVSEGVFRIFLEEQYVASTEHIEQTTEAIGQINKSAGEASPDIAEESLIGKAKRFYESTVSQMDVQRYIDRYKAAASEASEHAINLIVIFILQTVVIPIMFIWTIYRLFRNLMRMSLLKRVE